MNQKIIFKSLKVPIKSTKTLVKIIFLILFLFIFTKSLQLLPSQNLSDLFEQWKRQYKIKFITPQEQQKRKQFFIANVNKIKQFPTNQQSFSAYGINYMTAISNQEFRNIILTLKMPKIQTLNEDINKNKAKNEVKLSDAELLHDKEDKFYDIREDQKWKYQNFPENLNWINKGKVTNVKMQGKCGSSWVFSTTALVQSLALINEKQSKQININMDLSQQYLLQCTQSNKKCQGGYLKDAMQKVIKGNGIPSEKTFPYNPKIQHAQICKAPKIVQSPSQKILQKFYLLDQQIIQLLQKGPLNIGVNADSWRYYSSSDKKINTKIFQCHYESNSIIKKQQVSLINYSALLVGYDKDYWILKNSWGQQFGHNGYIYITRNRQANRNCMIGTYVLTFLSQRQECGIAYCQKCKPDQMTTCQKCIPGYYQTYVSSLTKNQQAIKLSEKNQQKPIQCLKCAETNCLKCYNYKLSQNQGICYLCKYGFSLAIDKGYVCQNFSNTNLDMCKYHFNFNQKSYCAECWNGFVRTNNYDRCLRCEVQNCKNCIIGEQKKCQNCLEDYSLNHERDKCLPKKCPKKCVGGCSKIGVCDKCQAGYKGSDCSIVQCNVDHCKASCSTPNTCKLCDVGYKGSNCEPIFECNIQNCKAGCIEDNVCIKCDPGYSGSTCNQIICIDSIKKENCPQGCKHDPKICHKCSQKFYGPQCDLTYDDISHCKSQISSLIKIKSNSPSGFYQELSTPTQYIQQQLNEIIRYLVFLLIVISCFLLLSWIILGIFYYRKKKIQTILKERQYSRRLLNNDNSIQFLPSSRSMTSTINKSPRLNSDVPSIKISQPLSPLMQDSDINANVNNNDRSINESI